MVRIVLFDEAILSSPAKENEGGANSCSGCGCGDDGVDVVAYCARGGGVGDDPVSGFAIQLLEVLSWCDIVGLFCCVGCCCEAASASDWRNCGVE